MPTFMSRSCFERLALVQRNLTAQVSGVGVVSSKPSDVFVPWAGRSLIESGRGLYYIGGARDACPASLEGQHFEKSLEETEWLVDEGLRAVQFSPFWSFLNKLTEELLGQSWAASSSRWGWSNLLKIACSEGSDPKKWPARHKAQQRDACIAALREELAHLHDSLVFVAYGDDFGILNVPILGGENVWKKDTEQEGRIWWFQDQKSGNLFIASYHPKYMRLAKITKEVSNCTVRLAREKLPSFEFA